MQKKEKKIFVKLNDWLKLDKKLHICEKEKEKKLKLLETNFFLVSILYMIKNLMLKKSEHEFFV